MYDDVRFIKQEEVDEFLVNHPSYEIAQKHSGDGPYIVAKKSTIKHLINEATRKHPAICPDGKINQVATNKIEAYFRNHIIDLANKNVGKEEAEEVQKKDEPDE